MNFAFSTSSIAISSCNNSRNSGILGNIGNNSSNFSDNRGREGLCQKTS